MEDDNDACERNDSQVQQDKEEARRRERFAKAIARAEFGRHYWDEKKNAELKQGARRGQKDRPKN